MFICEKQYNLCTCLLPQPIIHHFVVIYHISIQLNTVNFVRNVGKLKGITSVQHVISSSASGTFHLTNKTVFRNPSPQGTLPYIFPCVNTPPLSVCSSSKAC